MKEYVCDEFSLRTIIKCTFVLTNSETDLFMKLLSCNKSVCVLDLSKELKKDRSTIQKILLKLIDKGLIIKEKSNLEEGGYMFYYTTIKKSVLKQKILESVEEWFLHVKKEINTF